MILRAFEFQACFLSLEDCHSILITKIIGQSSWKEAYNSSTGEMFIIQISSEDWEFRDLFQSTKP